MSIKQNSTKFSSVMAKFINRYYFCTGKSLSEGLIFASTNPLYDDRLFIELQIQYINSKLKPGENMFCKKKSF